MSVKREFSKILHKRRKELSLSQKDMSELCNISSRHYQDWESGRSSPMLENAVYIAKAANISLDILKDIIMLNESSKLILQNLRKNGKI